jgi:hypothetical protein
MAYTAQQIVALVNSGKGPEEMYSGSTDASGMSALHEDIANEMRELQGAMQEHWSGAAAGQAYMGAGPLVQASQVSGQHLTQAQSLYTGQGSSFSDLSGKVKAVGNLGDRPADDWVSDTPLSFLSNRSDQIDQWNQKAQQVVDSYSVYHGQSSDNSIRWPAQYGELSLPSGGAGIQTAVPGEPGVQPGNRPGGDTAHRAVPRQGGSGSQPGTNVGGQGGVDGGTGSQPHQGTGPTGGETGGGPSGSSDGTGAAAYAPPAARGGLGGPGGGGPGGYGYPGTGFGPDGGGGDAFGPGVPGMGAGFGPGGGYGSGDGGFGPRGGSGSGGSGAGGLGAGKGAGAGALGESGPMGRAPGGPGAAGRMGGAGSSGMGAGAMGRGKGGEGEGDSEHKTAEYLLEPDPEDALVGELPRSVPPVIGI